MLFDRNEIHIQALVLFSNGNESFSILIFVKNNLEMISSKNLKHEEQKNGQRGTHSFFEMFDVPD